METDPESKDLTWEEVEPAAREIFALYEHRRERDWARDAWQILTATGLTSYRNETERCRAAVRLLALGSIFWDWCAAADWQATDGDELLGWTEDLDISTFRLGQLVGPDFAGDEDDENRLRRTALEYLTTEAREEVVGALKRSYGGDDWLFLALWRINHPAPSEPKPKPTGPNAAVTTAPTQAGQPTLFPDLAPPEPQSHLLFDEPPLPASGDEEDEEDDEGTGYYEDDGTVLNTLTAAKLAAYEWIADGCRKIRW